MSTNMFQMCLVPTLAFLEVIVCQARLAGWQSGESAEGYKAVQAGCWDMGVRDRDREGGGVDLYLPSIVALTQGRKK